MSNHSYSVISRTRSLLGRSIGNKLGLLGNRLHKNLLLLGLCLALAPACVIAAGPPVLEHVDGLPTNVYDQLGMSGDGQWIVWFQDAPPEMSVFNLTTEVALDPVIDLRTTTGDPDLDMPNDTFPVLSEDGSVIAVVADGPDGSRRPEVVLVLDRTGFEIARVLAQQYDGSTLQFEPEVQISADGRYVVFTTSAQRIRSYLGGSASYADQIEPGWNDDESFRLDTQTGTLSRVAENTGGNAVNDDVITHGISGDGRYVLFETDATDVLTGGSNAQLYVRDMSSSSVVRVSIDEDGNPVNDVRYSGGLSDDGSRVVFSDRDSLNEQHMYAWTRGKNSKLINSEYQSKPPVLSGNSIWMTQIFADFSRINLLTGSVYPLAQESFNDVSMNYVHFSSNGEMILFKSSSLTPPGGQSGDWWTLTFEHLPPIPGEVTETITTEDSIASLIGITIYIDELVVTQEIRVVTPPLLIWVDEVIKVDDDEGTAPPTPLIFKSGFE